MAAFLMGFVRAYMGVALVVAILATTLAFGRLISLPAVLRLCGGSVHLVFCLRRRRRRYGFSAALGSRRSAAPKARNPEGGDGVGRQR
jgi:hypothetical protein